VGPGAVHRRLGMRVPETTACRTRSDSTSWPPCRRRRRRIFCF